MNPVTYAQDLMKYQGKERALMIAENAVQTLKAVGTTGGVPFAEEVEMQEHTYTDKDTGKQTTKTVTIIDEAAKSKRLSKLNTFWVNVAGYIKKRQGK